MKELICILTALALASCGGSLSDEQRKKMRENMEANEIKRVSDAEMTEGAFEYGRKVAAALGTGPLMMSDRSTIDSIESVYKVKIISMVPGDSVLLEVERQIIEAYTTGAGQVQLSDDVQKLGTDSILYSKPLLRERPDGTLEFTRALGIHIPKREIVLSIGD